VPEAFACGLGVLFADFATQGVLSIKTK
jgi:hypothetical protein